MSNTKEPVKIVSLDSLDYIKTYIDTRSSEISNIISDLDKKYNDSYNTLSEETIELLNSKISEAKDSLTESFDSKYDKLKEELESTTDTETIKKLQDAIALLETEYNDINVALDKIKQDIEDGKSIFTEQEANELVETSFINGITMDDESGELSAEKLLTKKIVALIANFGSVKAESIESGEISGSTITSLENAPYKDIPMWGLYPDGSGHLAGGEINWDNSGNVTFGDNVTLSWNNITNKDDALNSISEDIENNIYDKHASALTNAIESAKVELNYKIDDELAKTREEQERLSTELSLLDDTVNTYNNTINDLSSTISVLSGKIYSWEDDSTLSPNELQQLSSDFEKLNVEHNSVITDINNLNSKLENWAISVEESETPISELDSNDIRNLKINIDNDSLLIQKYNIAKSVYEYYTKSEKDENNCILISEEYPLLSLAEYYATKSVYLLKYQEASTEYLTNNRFGSKTTWIGSDGLYSGTITGDNIVGIRLAGKTIESSSNCNLPENVTWKKYNNETVSFNTELGGYGPTWQISDSGSGHLANGNISWDNDGDVTFGPGVTLSWSQLDDAEDNVNNLVRSYDDRIISRRINDVRDVIYDEIQDNKNELELSISQNIKQAISTEISNYKVKSHEIEGNLFSGKTFISSKDDKLVNGTTYVTYSEPDSNGNYTFTENTAGDNTTSNAWQIRDDGTGYLSSGKFSWDKTGGITITDNNGYKAKLGGDSVIELLNNENTTEVSLNYSGLHIGSVDEETQTTIIRGRIGLSDSNNIVDISTSNNAARFIFGDYSIVISNTGISLSSENNSITLSEDGIGFPDLEPGYLYVNSDGILTTKSSNVNQ